MWECIIASLLGPAGLGCGHRQRDPWSSEWSYSQSFWAHCQTECVSVCVYWLDCAGGQKMLWHLFTQNKPLDCPIMPSIMASALMPVLTRLNMSLVTVTVVLGVLWHTLGRQVSCHTARPVVLFGCLGPPVSLPAYCASVNCYLRVSCF